MGKSTWAINVGETMTLEKMPGKILAIDRRKFEDTGALASPEAMCRATIEQAEEIMQQDGYHAPMIFFFCDHAALLWTLPGFDTFEEKEMAGRLARGVIQAYKPYAVVTVFEAWAKMVKRENRQEFDELVKNYKPFSLAADLESVEMLFISVEWRGKESWIASSEIERGEEGRVIGYTNQARKKCDGQASGVFADWFDNQPEGKL